MTVHFMDSIVFGDSVGTAEMRRIFDERSAFQRWLEVEVALAKAQASLGMIPGEAAETIAAQLFENSDSALSFWTQRHFTALNLVEACRSYNALRRPEAGLWGGPYEPRHRADAPDSSNPRPRRSTDFGDILR